MLCVQSKVKYTIFGESFEVFSSFAVFTSPDIKKQLVLKALVNGLLGQIIDTTTFTLSTALVLRSCPCFGCNIIAMEFDFIVEN